jgi:hypothetical protein
MFFLFYAFSSTKIREQRAGACSAQRQGRWGLGVFGRGRGAGEVAGKGVGG